MKITLSESAGFCPGVKRADDKIQSLLRGEARIYTLGSLIHNRLYNERLEALGIKCIAIEDVPKILGEHDGDIRLVIRTHGITKEENEYLLRLEAENPRLHIEDMTCPYVKRIHKIAEDNTGENTAFILFCDKNHPEAKGILSYAKGAKYPISSLDEAKSLNLFEKVPILCSQTTQNLLQFKEIEIFFKKLYTNLIFFDTICNVTEKRQSEAVALSKASDAMLVIGGKESSNTAKLYKLCRDICENTLWIESARDLEGSDFARDAQTLGITAGASTPEYIILEVLKQWKI